MLSWFLCGHCCASEACVWNKQKFAVIALDATNIISCFLITLIAKQCRAAIWKLGVSDKVKGTFFPTTLPLCWVHWHVINFIFLWCFRRRTSLISEVPQKKIQHSFPLLWGPSDSFGNQNFYQLFNVADRNCISLLRNND